jgi:hypothetical protein
MPAGNMRAARRRLDTRGAYRCAKRFFALRAARA